jgi:hypothetical protein
MLYLPQQEGQQKLQKLKLQPEWVVGPGGTELCGKAEAHRGLQAGDTGGKCARSRGSQVHLEQQMGQ